MSFLEVGASLLGGLLGSKSASSAAKAQAASTAQAIAEQRRQFDLTREDFAPYRETGANALAMLAQYLGLPPATLNNKTLDQIKAELAPTYTRPGSSTTPEMLSLGSDGIYNPGGLYHGREGQSPPPVVPGPPVVDQTALNQAAQAQFDGQPKQRTPATLPSIDPLEDPGYKFGMDQGMQALNRKVAASGGRVSGAALKAATQFGTNYGSTKYGEAYQRRQDTLNRLASLAGVGQTATNNSAVAGQGSANALSNLFVNQGDNAGAASLARGNIWGNAINQGVAAWQRRPFSAAGTPFNPGVGSLSAGGSPDGYW